MRFPEPLFEFSKTRSFGVGVLALCATVSAWKFPELAQKYAVLSGLLISAVTAFFLEIFPKIFDLLGRSREKARFLSFFGEVTAQTRGALLLVSYRKLKARPNKAEANGLGLGAEGKEARDFGDVFETLPEIEKLIANKAVAPEGLNGWAPLQDLRGANYVASELAKVVGQTPYFRTDKDIQTDPLDQIRATVISFGLGFNAFTHRIISCTGKELFYVHFSKGPRESYVTDNFGFNDIGVVSPCSTDYDIAIVARIPYPVPEGAPSRYFFICAGRTATGTAVAGQYLASHWREMYRLYKVNETGKSKDLRKDALLVVIAHRYHSLDSEDDAGHIAYKDDKPMIRWWRNREQDLKVCASLSHSDEGGVEDVSNMEASIDAKRGLRGRFMHRVLRNHFLSMDLGTTFAWVRAHLKS